MAQGKFKQKKEIGIEQVLVLLIALLSCSRISQKISIIQCPAIDFMYSKCFFFLCIIDLKFKILHL